jgi:hypothetical protein
MKNIFATTTFVTTLIMGNAFAVDKASLEDFCREIGKNQVLSKVASSNNGYYKVKKSQSYTNKRRKRYVTKTYRGCRFDTPWIKQAHELLCSGQNVSAKTPSVTEINKIDTPKSILFFFDGAGDFNAAKAQLELNAVNIDGSEGKDLGMGNANGLKALREMMDSHTHSLGLNKHNIELHYHASSGFKGRENYNSALSCAEQSKFYLDTLGNLGHNESSPAWIAMGYSNGGELTIDFQNDITDVGVSVDLALAIDPVVQTIKYPVHGMKEYIGEKHEKTKRLVSIYQDSDYGSLPVLDLQGKPVYNADENLLMKASEHQELLSSGYKNHIKMVGSEFVSDVTDCEFDKIFNSSSTCVY